MVPAPIHPADNTITFTHQVFHTLHNFKQLQHQNFSVVHCITLHCSFYQPPIVWEQVIQAPQRLAIVSQ